MGGLKHTFIGLGDNVDGAVLLLDCLRDSVANALLDAFHQKLTSLPAQIDCKSVDLVQLLLTQLRGRHFGGGVDDLGEAGGGVLVHSLEGGTAEPDRSTGSRKE